MDSAHVHCIICGKPRDISKSDEKYYSTIKYICKDCLSTFPSSYLMYRLECARNGIHDDSFDKLEWRLTFGDSRPYLKKSDASDIYLYK